MRFCQYLLGIPIWVPYKKKDGHKLEPSLCNFGILFLKMGVSNLQTLHSVWLLWLLLSFSRRGSLSYQITKWRLLAWEFWGKVQGIKRPCFHCVLICLIAWVAFSVGGIVHTPPSENPSGKCSIEFGKLSKSALSCVTSWVGFRNWTSEERELFMVHWSISLCTCRQVYGGFISLQAFPDHSTRFLSTTRPW